MRFLEIVGKLSLLDGPIFAYEKFKEKKMPKRCFLILLFVMVAFLLAPVWDQAAAQPRPGVPVWQPIPSAPGVAYAPELKRDVFRYQEQYYYYDGSRWHCGRSYQGPWVQIPQPPQVFYQVEERYFRTPPGWARGKKTGWRGQPQPPGQMKKLNQTGPPGKFKDKPIPPGQMKKMGY